MQLYGGPLDGGEYEGEITCDIDPDSLYAIVGCFRDGESSPYMFAMYRCDQGRLVYVQSKTVQQLIAENRDHE